MQGCRQGLEGRLPDFCQLLITTSHARNIAHAPKVGAQQLHHCLPNVKAIAAALIYCCAIA